MSALEAIGQELLAADRTRTPVPPPTERLPELSIADAYAIQRAGLRARIAEGAVVVGHKVGLTSAAMQEMLGVDQPDFGYLTAAMLVGSGATLSAGELIAPRAELEIAFRLRAPLAGPALTVDDVLAATDAVAPAIEIIDSRVADWRITIADTVADNASSARVVLGDWRPLDGLDLAAADGVLEVDSTTVHGRGDAVLGHPAAAVAWLAQALHEYAGEGIEAGQVVLPGAIGRAVPVAAGSSVRGTIDDIGEVRLEVGP